MVTKDYIDAQGMSIRLVANYIIILKNLMMLNNLYDRLAKLYKIKWNITEELKEKMDSRDEKHTTMY